MEVTSRQSLNKEKGNLQFPFNQLISIQKGSLSQHAHTPKSSVRRTLRDVYLEREIKNIDYLDNSFR